MTPISEIFRIKVHDIYYISLYLFCILLAFLTEVMRWFKLNGMCGLLLGVFGEVDIFIGKMRLCSIMVCPSFDLGVSLGIRLGE